MPAACRFLTIVLNSRTCSPSTPLLEWRAFGANKATVLCSPNCFSDHDPPAVARYVAVSSEYTIRRHGASGKVLYVSLHHPNTRAVTAMSSS